MHMQCCNGEARPLSNGEARPPFGQWHVNAQERKKLSEGGSGPFSNQRNLTEAQSMWHV